jgi:hypothetical protein
MKRILIVVFWVLTLVPLQAQDGTRTLFGGGLQFGIPMDAFRENLTNTGVGGGFSLLFRWGQLPVYLGMDVGIMKYDGEAILQRINIAGFFKDYELRTKNNILTAHLALRLQPESTWPVQPYLEGMFGTKGLFTVTNLVDITINGTEIVDSNTDESDFAFSYGISGGFGFYVFGNDGIGIDLKCTYLPGGNASYLVRRNDLTVGMISDPLDAFEKKNSPTTLLVPQIGITIKLSRLNDEEAPEYDY